MIIKITTRGDMSYCTLEGDTPFEREVNRRQSQHWINTGRDYPIDKCILEVLIDEYNNRHQGGLYS